MYIHIYILYPYNIELLSMNEIPHNRAEISVVAEKNFHRSRFSITHHRQQQHQHHPHTNTPTSPSANPFGSWNIYGEVLGKIWERVTSACISDQLKYYLLGIK